MPNSIPSPTREHMGIRISIVDVFLDLSWFGWITLTSFLAAIAAIVYFVYHSKSPSSLRWRNITQEFRQHWILVLLCIVWWSLVLQNSYYTREHEPKIVATVTMLLQCAVCLLFFWHLTMREDGGKASDRALESQKLPVGIEKLSTVNYACAKGIKQDREIKPET